MSRLRTPGFALLLLCGAALPLRAQGSVFALRGLGWSGRPVSARTAGTAGALAMFDPQMSLNPAALARWRSVAAWAVSAPTERTYAGPTGQADQQTVRFPLIGFAAILPSRAVIGFSISDYLDRTFSVTTRDSIMIRGAWEPFTDAGRSVGGISDLALGFGYRLRDNFHVGLGLHYYLGSTRLVAQRTFDNRSYTDITEVSLTDYRAAGVGAGLTYARRRFDVGLSARYNGSLRSGDIRNTVAYTPMPWQVAAGLRVQPFVGVFLAGSATYDGWERASNDLVAAGKDKARNALSLSVGAEVPSATLIKLRTPLRVGYRWRQLPFESLGDPLDEWAFSGGLGLSLARDRTTIDLSFEKGERQAGPARETFKSIFFGLTVRP